MTNLYDRRMLESLDRNRIMYGAYRAGTKIEYFLSFRIRITWFMDDVSETGCFRLQVRERRQLLYWVSCN
jgi:hypothetical protein